MREKAIVLAIADIAISVAAAEDFETDRVYWTFLSNTWPDVFIGARFGSIPEINLDKQVFDSGSNWSLYKAGGKWVILLHTLPDSGPRRLALLDPDFCKGRVYIRNHRAEQAYSYPLAYPLDEVLMINLLSRGRGVLLHACAISDGGQGIIFTGTSEAGKSTLATLWEGQRRVTLLSDDRVIVRQRERRFWVYGTPWHGDARVASSDGVPLERIFVIRHAAENKVIPLSPPEATSRLLVRSFPTFWDAEGMAFTLEFLSELSQAVPCYELGFVPDESVVDFVRCLM